MGGVWNDHFPESKIFFQRPNFQENPWNSAERAIFGKFQAPKFENSEPEKMQFIPQPFRTPTRLLLQKEVYSYTNLWKKTTIDIHSDSTIHRRWAHACKSLPYLYVACAVRESLLAVSFVFSIPVAVVRIAARIARNHFSLNFCHFFRCGSDAIRTWFGRGSDVVRTWFGCGSEVARTCFWIWCRQPGRSSGKVVSSSQDIWYSDSICCVLCRTNPLNN